MKNENVDIVVIGGGQAGLATGYYLSQQKRDFVIIDAHKRAGDSWRRRWDSLRLFTPPGFNQLPGLQFPKSADHLPTKDQMADYLESYAARFCLPISLDTRVKELRRDGDKYLVTADKLQLKARHVILATGAHPTPRPPAFASELDPAIQQLHSVDYRNPSQLREGPVLVVGAGNSGVEIALELAAEHSVWLAGRDTGFLPAQFGKWSYELGVIAFKALMQHLNADTPPGRWLLRRARAFTGGHPVVGITPQDLDQAGVQRVSPVTGISRGKPVLADGRVVDVVNVIWSTGFVHDFHWIKLPIFDDKGDPIHHRGLVQAEPGLYFTGLPFQSSILSGLVAGAGPDAKYVTEQIASRSKKMNSPRVKKVREMNKQVSNNN